MDAVQQTPIRVLLVDDHQLLVDALAGLLRREVDIDVIGVARSVAEAERAALEPLDVALMDYRLPDGTGAMATRKIKARWPGAKVIILTAVDDDETMLDAIMGGADGYLTKDRASDEVVDAVRAAHAGEILLPTSVVYEIVQRVQAARGAAGSRRSPEQLTPREMEVLAALARGLSSSDICGELLITPNTLRTHVQNIMSKLHVHSKLEAVAVALRQNLLDVSSGDLYP
jgi:DNA-binding NarL/FixJ family response regulator